MRLLHSGPARWHPGLCPGRDRARQQAHQDSRSHAASHRGLDRPAGPQPNHGSRRAGAPGQVHDPRPRLELHRRIRRSPRRCRDTDRALQRPDAAHERDRRTLDQGCRREFLDRTLVWNQAHLRRTLHAYEIHCNQHRPNRSLGAAAPLKPLPEPVDLDRYRVRRQTHTACLINEYRLVALRGRGFRHAHHQGLQQEPPLRDPGHVVDIIARIERRQVLGRPDQRIPQSSVASENLLVSGYERVLARLRRRPCCVSQTRSGPEPPRYDRGTRTRRMRVALRWRGSRARTDTTHCPISRYQLQR